jgi:ribosomal protein S1
MRPFWIAAVLALSLAAASARAQTGNTPANIIQGDVVNIENGEYFIKDRSGHEIALKVDQSTQMKDRIKVGDRVEAHVGADGHADSIRVRLPDDELMKNLGLP